MPIQPANILFLDIETVPLVYNWDDLDTEWQQLYLAKSAYWSKEVQSHHDLYKKAGIYSEFAKVICIACAYLEKDHGFLRYRSRVFYGHDEKKILLKFADFLRRHAKNSSLYLCAHNGKEFDFPFLCRRILINQMHLPEVLNIQSKKPWETQHLDTLELWKFGDHKHYVSLELLAAVFRLPSPKSDIRGSDVARIYWEDNDLDRIRDYCIDDVKTLTQLFFRLKPDVLSGEIRFYEEELCGR